MHKPPLHRDWHSCRPHNRTARLPPEGRGAIHPVVRGMWHHSSTHALLWSVRWRVCGGMDSLRPRRALRRLGQGGRGRAILPVRLRDPLRLERTQSPIALRQHPLKQAELGVEMGPLVLQGRYLRIPLREHIEHCEQFGAGRIGSRLCRAGHDLPRPLYLQDRTISSGCALSGSTRRLTPPLAAIRSAWQVLRGNLGWGQYADGRAGRLSRTLSG